MHLRALTRSDLPDVATITANCNLEDTLSRYTIKNIETEYTSYRIAEYSFIRRAWNAPGRQAFVLAAAKDELRNKLESVEKQSSNETARTKNEVIIGWAWFSRQGTSDTAKAWQRSSHVSFADSVERSLLAVEDFLTYFVPKPGVHRAHRAIVDAHKTPELDALFPTEYWSVDGIMVAPAYQRQGYGKVMLDWVFARAREEIVLVVVDGSPKGGVFYKKHGFRSIGEIGFHVYFDETEHGGERYQRWLWEPERTSST